MKTTYEKTTWTIIIGGAIIGIIASVLSGGCIALGITREDAYAAINEAIEIYDEIKAERRKKPAETPPAVDAEKPKPIPHPAGDYADFSAFNFKYGSFRGAGAVADENVEIGNLKLNPNGLSLTWVRGLEAWGLAYAEASALACFFVKNPNGDWVGGKFEWISTSRSTRTFNNIYDGYNGWILSDIPNPTDAALVIVSENGKKRSNVIGGEWRR